jgi:hypothetical protein
MGVRDVAIVGQLLETTEWPPTENSIRATQDFDIFKNFLGAQGLGSRVVSELVNTFGLDPSLTETARVAFAVWHQGQSPQERDGEGIISYDSHYVAGVLGRLRREEVLSRETRAQQEYAA